MNDSDVEQFDDITAVGALDQTFVISETENPNYPDKIVFSEPEIDALVMFSADAYKNFFADGNLGTKQLYRLHTMLVNSGTIEKLSDYVVSGEINISALNSGSEMLIITDRASVPYNVGETLKIGSVMRNNAIGIDDVVETNVKIGAVVSLPKDADKLLKYAASDGHFNLLTTAAGARANGLHNAVYTELFAHEDIDGGLIPTSAGARLTSYSELKRREFLENAAESGGLIMLFTLMSLLGFSAYFSGIGIKIRQRAYEISILRSVGTPLKKIRAKLILDGLVIPFISTAAAGGGVFAVQKITENAYAKLELLHTPEYSKLENLYELKGEVIEKFFLENRLWTVPTAVPLVIIFLITAMVTTLLTLSALRKFKGDIASDLNFGRTRQ